ncbi:phage terminase large subunit family protein [Paenibacillus larvae]|nr:phage terminase large subunit family protein [Paenibacillus larvae]MDT2243117.1 phage terminase large subunit family protein [Paenibacillus larvae]
MKWPDPFQRIDSSHVSGFSIKAVSQAKSRDSGNSILHKQFPGGQITLAGANSPASLAASRPIRIALCDEIDRFPASAGAEGTQFLWLRKEQQRSGIAKSSRYRHPQ